MSFIAENENLFIFKKITKRQYLTLHTIVARILSIVLVARWYLLFVHCGDPEKRFSFEYLLYSGSIAVCITVGLWLSTTKWGASHCVIVSFLLLPSLVAPLFVTSHLAPFSLVLGVVLWSYWTVLRRERKHL